MFEQIEYGVRLYLRNFLFLALVALPISIPANLLIEYVTYGQEDSMGQFRIVSLIQFAASSFMAGAIITSLRSIVLKQQLGVGQALRNGMKYWTAVLATVFVANLISGFALLALIIPGILCFVRFALIDQVVVLEDCHGAVARQRSWELTRGCAWWILLLACLFYPLVIVLAAAPGVIWAFVDLPLAAELAINLLVGCTVDVLTPLMTCILFSFYWHAAGRMVEPNEPVADDELPDVPFEPNDDANPFRAPQAT